MLPDHVIAEMRKQRAEILELLDAQTRTTLETEAPGGHDEQMEMLGHILHFVNVVGGTPAQLAELINRRYRGVHDVQRTAEVALAIARGEETVEANAGSGTTKAKPSSGLHRRGGRPNGGTSPGLPPAPCQGR
jgi:hypothetical protein